MQITWGCIIIKYNVPGTNSHVQFIQNKKCAFSNSHLVHGISSKETLKWLDQKSPTYNPDTASYETNIWARYFLFLYCSNQDDRTNVGERCRYWTRLYKKERRWHTTPFRWDRLHIFAEYSFGPNIPYPPPLQAQGGGFGVDYGAWGLKSICSVVCLERGGATVHLMCVSGEGGLSAPVDINKLRTGPLIWWYSKIRNSTPYLVIDVELSFRTGDWSGDIPVFETGLFTRKQFRTGLYNSVPGLGISQCLK